MALLGTQSPPLPVRDSAETVHDIYRKVPIVATLVTFGISSLLGSLRSGGRYFRGTKTMKQS